jgi:hypothetical protein
MAIAVYCKDSVPPWNVLGATLWLGGKELREGAQVVSILATAFVYIINDKLPTLSQVVYHTQSKSVFCVDILLFYEMTLQIWRKELKKLIYCYRLQKSSHEYKRSYHPHWPQHVECHICIICILQAFKRPVSLTDGEKV